MCQDFLPLCRPSIDEHDIQAAVEVMRSGWITTGQKNNEFEQQVNNLTGAPYAVALSSATAGMHLTLLALGVGPGDEVITPSLTWVSTVNLITLVGATPIFVDVDPDTLMVSADDIAPLITEHTKLIIPVHYAGAPLDLDPIYVLAQRHNIAIIEDAAHALGTGYKGCPIGNRGTCLFSTHAIKNVTTAEGGLLTTFDAALAERVRRLKFHGLGVDTFERETQGRAPQAEVIEPGFKYNMPDICAVLALGQLKRLKALNQQRRMLSRAYVEQLGDIAGITPLATPCYEHQHSHHLMIVKVDPELTGVHRDRLISELKAHQIGAGIHFKPVHSQKYYRDNYTARFGRPLPILTHTDCVGQQICSLPLFPAMELKDVTRVIDALKRIVKSYE
jgi:UDP-4-amino-4-deoxy-L-arabinose-oxoglutarate aminotransferase